ncbi:YciI family protein [Micromonospora yasonensis]|uniref:YciI family protein n=1 Tax=Micromonospora yasonensis TaxID=1128667 RepID=UPI0022319BB3|nr:YciI family protein [Micromonospora yasonensis]MCW3839175.1 YciI family protein [Micromonospora yasonensis]
MRYMLMHKLDEAVPGTFEPSPEFMKRMGAYFEEVAKAGILLAAEGLCKSSEESARITATTGKTTITDGPFTETKELIAGFGLIEVRSKEEAVEWAKRFVDVFTQSGIDVEVDVRRVSEGPHEG